MVKRSLRTPRQCMALARRKQRALLHRLTEWLLLPDLAELVGGYHIDLVIVDEFERQLFLETDTSSRLATMAKRIVASQDADICKWRMHFMATFDFESYATAEQLATFLWVGEVGDRCYLTDCWFQTCNCTEPCTEEWILLRRRQLASGRRKRLKRLYC